MRLHWRVRASWHLQPQPFDMYKAKDNAVNQPLAKQPPMWGLCWCAKWKGMFHLLSWEAQYAPALSRQKVGSNFWPTLSCSNRKRNSATHNRWTHLSLVGQTYMLLLVSCILGRRWSFCNCLLECNHVTRAEMQVLKCCFWWGMNGSTFVTLPICNQITIAHVHRKKMAQKRSTQSLYKTQDIWEVWATKITFVKGKLHSFIRPNSSMR